MASHSSDQNVLTSLSDAMADAVERAGMAVVTVDARRRLPASGVAYAADLVLTADHVIEREEDIRLLLPDGSEAMANLAGRDPGTDLALLRLSRPSLSVADFAPQAAHVGQMVLALGRPTADGLQASLGVISAVGGPVRFGHGGVLERYYRTDAIPYPGFSGGPLIDPLGRILGINTSGLGRGASIAIPIDLAMGVGAALSQHGRVRRGYLGIRSQPVVLPAAQQQALGRDQASGLLLVAVEESSPAAQGGLLVGDILVAMGDDPVSEIDQLQSKLFGVSVGSPVSVQVLRGGQPVTMTVTIGER